MKEIYTKYRLLAAATILTSAFFAMGNENREENSPFIEDGKIWWYEVGQEYPWEPASSWKIRVGVTTKGAIDIDGERWSEVHLMDSTGNIVTAHPLALLREDGNKVYVTADHINDSDEDWREKVYADGPDTYAYIIETYTGFLHHWERNGLDKNVIDTNISFPALLYDFDWKVNDRFSWPWAWPVAEDASKGWIPTEVFIKDEGKELCLGAELTYWEIGHDNPDSYGHCHVGRIIDNIGVTHLEYLTDWNNNDWHHGGFFFNPGQLLPPVSTDMYEPKRIPPYLVKVERSDGTIIYEGRQSNVEDIFSKDSPCESQSIFDLHGRPVSNPQPRSVYIRGGKKFVAR